MCCPWAPAAAQGILRLYVRMGVGPEKPEVHRFKFDFTCMSLGNVFSRVWGFRLFFALHLGKHEEYAIFCKIGGVARAFSGNLAADAAPIDTQPTSPAKTIVTNKDLIFTLHPLFDPLC